MNAPRPPRTTAKRKWITPTSRKSRNPPSTPSAPVNFAPGRSYKGTKKPLKAVARELAVDAVVEGSVMRSGEKVRITAQLVHGATDRHLWAESYQRDLRDVLSMQSEVARAIAREIQAKLTSQDEKRLGSVRPVNPEAHELYLKGRLR